MKLISIVIAVVSIVALLTGDVIAQPGFYTAINADGVNRVAAKVLPGFIAQVNGATFPDIRDGHHRILNTHVSSIGLESFNMGISDDGIISLYITRFNVSVEFKYRYKRKNFRTSTRIRATLGDANFHIHLKLWNEGGKFAVGVHDVHVSAGEASIKFLGKSIKSKFLNAVKSLFKSRIKNTMLGKIREVLQNGLAGFANSFISSITMRANVADWGSIDFSLVEGIRYGANNVIVGFSGDIQAQNDHSPTPVPRHGIAFNPTDRLFSVGIDTFVFNSGFHNFFKHTRFNHVSTKQEPRGYNGVALETNAWGESLPALKKNHPNLDIRLVLRFGEAPVLNSNGGQLRFHSVVHSHVQVGSGENWATAFVIGTTLDAAATVALHDNAIFAQIQDITTQLSVVQTEIGNIDVGVAVIQGLLQFTVDVAVPLINTQLLAGIPLPVNGHMVIANAAVAFPENAIVAAADIDFNF